MTQASGVRGRTVRFLGAALVAVLAVGCGGSDDGAGAGTTSTTEAAAPEPTTVVVEHARGTSEVPAQPERVVSAGVSMTGHLLSLDVPVIATATTRASNLTDAEGRFVQWAELAEEQGIELLAGPLPNVEEIAALRPDVIVGSAVGADAVDDALYEQLSSIAPTIVFDHSASSWQDLAVELGAALGREDEAAATTAAFDQLVEDVAGRIDTSHPVVATTVNPDGLNVFTATSAHGQLLTALGLTVTEVEPSVGEDQIGERHDIAPLSHERTDLFGDSTILVVLADEATAQGYLGQFPLLAATPAAREGRVISLGFESFRLDRFSATTVVERLAEALAA